LQIRKARQTIFDGAEMIPNTVDITPYLVNVPPEAANTQVSVGMLFMLNHFVKIIIRQLATEASDDGKAADSLGILVVTIFANPKMRPNGVCLIDLFWAKLHKSCPVLFGITSPPLRTQAARARLGWRADDSDDEHYRRMRGFGVGFAAVTLRDFSKSANPNPAPNHLYWTALARILSTPPNQQSPTQYVVLQHMIKLYVPRFIGFYGSAAIAALRQACIEFPATAPKNQDGTYDSSIVALQTLPHTLQKECNLSL
jgi:nucleoporin GLE1